MDAILEILAKIGFDWKLGLFNFINFMVLFWILKKFFFLPVSKLIEERQAKIQESVDNIKKAEAELAMAKQNAGSIIFEAKDQANSIIARARDEAQEQSTKMKDKAKEELNMLVVQAKKNIEIEKQKMQQEVKHDLSELISAVLHKILGKTITEKQDKNFIDKTIRHYSL